jgi:glucans biosynthesis protein
MTGRGQHYGMSMRGIAIDTALPSGEEFPRFTQFWLVRPPPESNRMQFFALLDSESLSGAYAFELESRANARLRVQVRLFARTDVGKLGVAPLTSMFTWGENRGRSFDDVRPEVHDSDGLLQHTGSGEWIWRPLVNPPTLQVSGLLDIGPLGFGLAQRDRNFASYQDPRGRYERRPGVWVTPGEGDWGPGAVQLVEIPSPDETNDNIVAFWVGNQPFKAGQTRSFSYELRTFEGSDNPEGLAIVDSTRIGWATVPGAEQQPPPSVRRFTVDFRGGELKGLAAAQPVQAMLTVNHGTAGKASVAKLPVDETWRGTFTLTPADESQPVNLRLFLTLRGRRISETWNYVWNPATVQAP